MAPSGSPRALMSLAWASSSYTFETKLRPRMKPHCTGAPIFFHHIRQTRVGDPNNDLVARVFQTDGAGVLPVANNLSRALITLPSRTPFGMKTCRHA
eukprot:8954276-Pyramimonas_sp.AAC.1